jgi:tetratricopeptide (TPR) repeat protein
MSLNSPSSARRYRRTMPWWRKCLYSAITVTVLFVLLELVLAVAGVRPISERGDPFVGFTGQSPLFVPETQPEQGTRWMRTARGKLPWFNDQRFPDPKPAGTYRIVCLGGSTTQGQPYDDSAAFSGWLRELLQETAGERWEVINAGGISYASYRVTVLMEELIAYEPDLFIIYTGHNEFLEERTYGDLRRRTPWLRTIGPAVNRTRTAAVMNSLLRGSPSETQTLLPAEVDAVLDRSIGPESYHRDEALREQVLEHFEFNLNRMAEIARRAGAEVLFVVPAVSLKDCSPFKSQHREGISETEQKQFQWLLERGRTHFDEERYDEALDLFRQAERIDPRYAAVHDELSRTLFALGRYDEARQAAVRAVDEDVCPLRAISEIPEIVARVARRQRALLVDYRALVDDASRARYGHAVPGAEFFLDHVHPTIAGHRMLAVALLETLAEAGIVQPREDWRDSALDAVTGRIESRLDEEAHGIALRNLAKVLAWAGRHDEAGRLVLAALEAVPDDPESHYLAGCHFKHVGEHERAVQHFHIALPHRTGDGQAHRLLAGSLAEMGDWQAALRHFDQARRLLPDDPELHSQYAVALAETGRRSEAIAHFRQALRDRPDDPDLHYNLGILLSEADDPRAAEQHLSEAIRLRPDDAAAHYALGTVLSGRGDAPRAATHFQHALRIRPDFDAPRRALETLPNAPHGPD